MKKSIMHIVLPMDNSKIQRCVLCGFTVKDNTKSILLDSIGTTAGGFKEGAVYITGDDISTATSTEPEAGSIACNNMPEEAIPALPDVTEHKGSMIAFAIQDNFVVIDFCNTPLYYLKLTKKQAYDMAEIIRAHADRIGF